MHLSGALPVMPNIRKKRPELGSGQDQIICYILLQVNFLQVFSQCLCSYIMTSPGDKKGQRRGLCGHIMASFDLHKRCARCRDKNIGDDDCVEKRPVLFVMGSLKFKRKYLPHPHIRYVKTRNWVF